MTTSSFSLVLVAPGSAALAASSDAACEEAALESPTADVALMVDDVAFTASNQEAAVAWLTSIQDEPMGTPCFPVVHMVCCVRGL